MVVEEDFFLFGWCWGFRWSCVLREGQKRNTERTRDRKRGKRTEETGRKKDSLQKKERKKEEEKKEKKEKKQKKQKKRINLSRSFFCCWRRGRGGVRRRSAPGTFVLMYRSVKGSD